MEDEVGLCKALIRLHSVARSEHNALSVKVQSVLTSSFFFYPAAGGMKRLGESTDIKHTSSIDGAVARHAERHVPQKTRARFDAEYDT